MDAEFVKFFGDSVRKAVASSSGAGLDAALEEFGWGEALSAEPRLAVSTLFEAQGAANATSSALDLVLCDALGVEAAPVLLPRSGWGVPGPTGVLLAPAEQALVVTDEGVFRGAVEARPLHALDHRLTLVAAAVQASEPVAADGTWSAAVAAGQVALAHELVGASRTMLRLAVEHATSREQGGRFISGYQAIRHKLAESHVAIESAAAAVGDAWESEDPLAPWFAKAIAGRCATTVAKHAQQTLAGMGFTTEHVFHHHLRRTRTLDQLLGSTAQLTRALGERLLETRTLPEMLPL